jgi:hypothetical protein
MPVSDCGGAVASEIGFPVGESIDLWSADFHLSHLSDFFRPLVAAWERRSEREPSAILRDVVEVKVSASDSDYPWRVAHSSFGALLTITRRDCNV